MKVAARAEFYMKVGDLIRHIPNGAMGLIVSRDNWSTMVKWCDNEIVEDVNSYSVYDVEVASESR